jgi:hypothetical protein
VGSSRVTFAGFSFRGYLRDRAFPLGSRDLGIFSYGSGRENRRITM